jgi:hypothetical protein
MGDIVNMAAFFAKLAQKISILAGVFLLSLPLSAKVVVFWQPGFPTVDSQPVPRATLQRALDGMHPEFAGIAAIRAPQALLSADLLVLPYGSAFPADAWPAITQYLAAGGNLLVLGGRPFLVPVRASASGFTQEFAQDTYARALGFPHSYEIPLPQDAAFAWRQGYEFLSAVQVRAERFYAVEGRLNGLGYMQSRDGALLAAPVIVADRVLQQGRPGARPSRAVMLDFDPAPGYWDTQSGAQFIRQTAAYAAAGVRTLSTEVGFSAIRPGEMPKITVRLHRERASAVGPAQDCVVRTEILSGEKKIASAQSSCSTARGAWWSADIPVAEKLPIGFYTVRATYLQNGQPQESSENGFWVAEKDAVHSGSALGVNGNFLTRGGKPFFPFGTNYFTTEEDGWDFAGPRNAQVWQHDFAQMERHGVTWVRTGVWMSNAKLLDAATGGVNPRFLRNLEAYLLCAQQHHIAVNFTFFAFSPVSGTRPPRSDATTPIRNPYLDPAAVAAEKKYVLSVVERFKNVPWLCWDLINEPSFSNPRKIFQGNVPNGDTAELAAWQAWLKKRYGSLEALGLAWSVPPELLQSFQRIPLPDAKALKPNRYGSTTQVRAYDYNLFAQQMFTQWVQGMVAAIRSTGSRQLIDVGQDEGGVTDRVLNHFYVDGGVSFTTNHTYWQDDALLWDAVAEKTPDVPGITGETGYQPVWNPDGSWRYDELTGWPLLERKWALGFADGNSGALQWDWAREPDFGMLRSDGSQKIWEDGMRRMGGFVQQASTWATAWIQPQTVLVLPQSLQLSTWNAFAVRAQKNAVRALYQYARGEAIAVGEDQLEKVGAPKLMILPSPFVLTPQAWDALEQKVRQGSTLLLSGPFDLDEHFHPTERQRSIGLPYRTVPLELREQQMHWPGGVLHLTYGGDRTTYLTQAQMPGGNQWAEVTLGRGRILFSALPLELNDNLESIGAVYRFAMSEAGVQPSYFTPLRDSGILICPTEFPHATLYVMTSESNQEQVIFRDQRSGAVFTGALAPGHAALLLISDKGKVLADYNWQPQAVRIQ